MGILSLDKDRIRTVDEHFVLDQDEVRMQGCQKNGKPAFLGEEKAGLEMEESQKEILKLFYLYYGW